MRILVAALLRRMDFTVEVCSDGDAAMRLFAMAPTAYASALVDLSMPGRTGVELTADLRALRPELPVILMSGDHDRYGRLPLTERPEVVRLPKPFAVGELRLAKEKALSPMNRPEPGK